MKIESETGLRSVRFGSPDLENLLKQFVRSGSQSRLHILLVGASSVDQEYAAQFISRSLNCVLKRLCLSELIKSEPISLDDPQVVLYLEKTGALFGEAALLNPEEPQIDSALVQKIKLLPGHILFSTGLFDPLEAASWDLLDFVVEIPGG